MFGGDLFADVLTRLKTPCMRSSGGVGEQREDFINIGCGVLQSGGDAAI